MLHIVLYQPEIPANVGNIMRTSAAIGAVLHVVGPFPFPLYSKELSRAALDYGTMLDMHVYDDYQQFMRMHLDIELFMVTRHGKRLYSDVVYPSGKPLYLMFGSESSGIPLEILQRNINNTVRIPMRPAARSLNLANSVAIVAYEVYRQWDFENLALSEVLKGVDYL